MPRQQPKQRGKPPAVPKASVPPMPPTASKTSRAPPPPPKRAVGSDSGDDDRERGRAATSGSDDDDDDDDDDDEDEDYDEEDGDDGESEEGSDGSDDDDDDDEDDEEEEDSGASDASSQSSSEDPVDSDDDGFEDQGSSSDDDDAASDGDDDAASEGDDSDSDASSSGSVAVLPDVSDLAPPRSWSSGLVKSGGLREAVVRRELENLHDDAVHGVNRDLLHIDDLSSDDEEAGNAIGKVPLHWYDEYEHIGYKNDGTKVPKGGGKTGDGESGVLDAALRNADDPSARFTIHDALNGRDVTLTPREVEIIRRIQAGAFAHPEHEANPDYVDYYSSKIEISGINADRDEPKARFQPSKFEALKVRRLLQKLKDGKIDMDYLTGKKRSMQPDKNEENDKNLFMLWKGDEEDELSSRKGPMHIAAPKTKPPSHAESYNPPGEYLPSEKELADWQELDPEDRPHGLLIPKKFPNLRSVGAYEHSVRERFERCLDLYLCPRAMKRRLNIDPESLVPQLPKAQDLKPFPTVRCVRFVTPVQPGEDKPPRIRCISPSPDGQYLASGGDDGVVRLWEVQTGKLLRSWDLSPLNLGEPPSASSGVVPPSVTAVTSVEFNPNRAHHVLLASAGWGAVVIGTGTGSAPDSELTEALLAAARGGGGVLSAKAAKAVSWKGGAASAGAEKPISKAASSAGVACVLALGGKVSCAKWHKRGDYFVTVCPKVGAASVLIHQLSKGTSQQPFSKNKGEIVQACFHPSKPFLFVATQQNVRIYHLIKQAMVKKLISGMKMISSIDCHSSGDHLLVGSLDRRMAWFDLDLASTPYKTLKYHTKAVRSVCYHPRYPLMASASDDGNVHIFHAAVYSDLLRNPLIVPVKVLRNAHKVEKLLGVLCCVFHPTLPWIFTAGADGEIHLWQDI